MTEQRKQNQTRQQRRLQRKQEMEHMAENDRKDLDRRSFMKLAGLGAGAAGATIGLGAAEAGASEAKAKPEHAGYRETEHVKTYYRMARF
jgi:hypothetical protein